MFGRRKPRKLSATRGKTAHYSFAFDNVQQCKSSQRGECKEHQEIGSAYISQILTMQYNIFAYVVCRLS